MEEAQERLKQTSKERDVRERKKIEKLNFHFNKKKKNSTRLSNYPPPPLENQLEGGAPTLGSGFRTIRNSMSSVNSNDFTRDCVRWLGESFLNRTKINVSDMGGECEDGRTCIVAPRAVISQNNARCLAADSVFIRGLFCSVYITRRR